MSHTYTGINSWANGAVLPDDNDDLTAASVNVPLEALFNNTKYLANRQTPSLYQLFNSYNSDPQTALATNSGDWGTGGDATDITLCSGGYTVMSTDRLEISVTFGAYTDSTAYSSWRLAYKIGSSGTLTAIPGTEMRPSKDTFGNSIITLSTNGLTYLGDGALYVYLQCRVYNGTGNAKIYSPYHSTMKIWRA